MHPRKRQWRISDPAKRAGMLSGARAIIVIARKREPKKLILLGTNKCTFGNFLLFRANVTLTLTFHRLVEKEFSEACTGGTKFYMIMGLACLGLSQIGTAQASA